MMFALAGSLVFKAVFVAEVAPLVGAASLVEATTLEGVTPLRDPGPRAEAFASGRSSVF